MDAQLQYALEHSLKTTAPVKSNDMASACIEQASDYWIRTHLGDKWTIVTVDLTLITNILIAEGKYVQHKQHGILQKYDFSGHTFENMLFIYSSDRYTDTWVHDLALATASNRGHRILNVVRNDPGEAIDLGMFHT